MRLFISLACSIAVCPLFALGCAAQDGADAPTGTLELPLEQTGTDGALYHLSAFFNIENSGSSTLFLSSTAEPEILLPMAPGLVTVTIQDGWTLTRSDDHGGTFQPVSAVLGSLRAQQTRVLANHTDSVTFEFLVRSTSGDLAIEFGVNAHPRELAGAVVIDQGTSAFASYPHNAQVDFATYYQLDELDKNVLPDGSKDRALVSVTTATEFFNDGAGALSSFVAPQLEGAFIEWHLVAKPDGTEELSGEIDGQLSPFVQLKFGPHTFASPLPLDPDGFVSDAFFFETVPFTLDLFDGLNSHMNGTMRLRSIPAGN